MSSRRRVLAGAFSLICVLQYFVAEVIAAAAWHGPRYSWMQDYISELGATDCGPDLCSPNHLAVEISVIAHACLVVVAMLCLSELFLSRRSRVAIRWLVCLHATGNLIMARYPLSNQGANDVHYLGAALAIIAGILLVATAGIVQYREQNRHVYAVFSLVCSSVAVAGLVLVRWNATEDLGMPSGLLERMSVDPLVLWYAVTGVVLAVVTLAPRAALSRFVSTCEAP